jgi:hypothetical protein
VRLLNQHPKSSSLVRVRRPPAAGGKLELIPTLGPETIRRMVERTKHSERERVDPPLWIASGGEGAEAAHAFFAQDAFGEY